jgi:phage replication O-like protein O
MSTAENVADLTKYRKQKEPPVVAQIEDGYTMISNTLMDAAGATDLSGSELSVLLLIIRHTYGFKRKVWGLTNTYLAAKSVYCVKSISKAKKSLIDRKMIWEDEQGLVGPNPVISDWVMTDGKSEKRAKAANSMREQLLQQAEQMLQSDGTNAPVDGNNCSSSKERTKERTKEIDLPSSPQADDETITKPNAVIQKGTNWGTQEDLDVVNQMESILAGWQGEDYRPPKPAALAKKCNDVRMMRTADDRKPEHILTLFKIAQADKFWRKNCMAPSSVRKHWATLVDIRNDLKKSMQHKPQPKTIGADGQVRTAEDWDKHIQQNCVPQFNEKGELITHA